MSYANLQTKADNLEAAARGFYIAGEADLARFYKGAADGFRCRANNMLIEDGTKGDDNGKE